MKPVGSAVGGATVLPGIPIPTPGANRLMARLVTPSDGESVFAFSWSRVSGIDEVSDAFANETIPNGIARQTRNTARNDILKLFMARSPIQKFDSGCISNLLSECGASAGLR